MFTGARWGAIVWWEGERRRTETNLKREETTVANTTPTRVILRTRPIHQIWRIQMTCYRTMKKI
jgi:hypothetical protein